MIAAEDEVAGASPYWNPKTETLGREQLESLQLAKLRYRCEWAAARSPWYLRAVAAEQFEPSQLRTIGDLRGLPILTRDQWMASQDAMPPYGELPAIGGEGAIRVHTTSGTTGRGPQRALDSRKDWAWIAEMWSYAIWGCDARPADTAYIAFGYGSFIGFWGLHVHLGARSLGGGGLVMSEMMCVSEIGRITPGCAGMYREDHVEVWRRIVSFAHDYGGAAIGAQLGHSGRKGSTKLMWDGIDEPLESANWALIAPSPVPYGPLNQVPREMSAADFDTVLAEFVWSARGALAAGFDLCGRRRSR